MSQVRVLPPASLCGAVCATFGWRLSWGVLTKVQTPASAEHEPSRVRDTRRWPTSYRERRGTPSSWPTSSRSSAADAIAASCEPAKSEGPVNFDGGARESEPPPSDPLADHNELVGEMLRAKELEDGEQ